VYKAVTVNSAVAGYYYDALGRRAASTACPEEMTWVLRIGLVETAINDLSLVVQYMSKLPNADECDLILLGPSGSTAPREELGWSPAGFDVGYFESEWSHFSVILNEVLFGVHDELRSFASRLNEHLLVETFEESWTLLKDRNRLARLGADLEQASRLEPIPVFLPYYAA
jgi:hypothetical protein